MKVGDILKGYKPDLQDKKIKTNSKKRRMFELGDKESFKQLNDYLKGGDFSERADFNHSKNHGIE